jgi:hypothetical protein
MFRSRVFGGTPDAFHVACEYGPASVPGSGNMPTPEALTPMELDWTSAESETQVTSRRGAAACIEPKVGATWLRHDCLSLSQQRHFGDNVLVGKQIAKTHLSGPIILAGL